MTCPSCGEWPEDCSCTDCVTCDQISYKGHCTNCYDKLKAERDRLKSECTSFWELLMRMVKCWYDERDDECPECADCCAQRILWKMPRAMHDDLVRDINIEAEEEKE